MADTTTRETDPAPDPETDPAVDDLAEMADPTRLAVTYAESLDIYRSRLETIADADPVDHMAATHIQAAASHLQDAIARLREASFPPRDAIAAGARVAIAYDSTRTDPIQVAEGEVDTITPADDADPAAYTVVIDDETSATYNDRQVIADTTTGAVDSRGPQRTLNLGDLVAIDVLEEPPNRLPDGGLERPGDCLCPLSKHAPSLPCWPCVREGFDEANPDPPEQGPTASYSQ